MRSKKQGRLRTEIAGGPLINQVVRLVLGRGDRTILSVKVESPHSGNMLDSMLAFNLPPVAAIQRTAMSPLGAGECQRQLISGCLLENSPALHDLN